ncbi:MAG: c-type cytochrome [Candidatus Glassbacteria bacterium]
MKWLLCIGLFSLFFLMVTSTARTGDVEAGKAKSTSCVACHGKSGISKMSSSPNLAGQQEQYLVSAMKSYRDSTRENSIMTPLMQSLSDEDIENIASYYASLSCK